MKETQPYLPQSTNISQSDLGSTGTYYTPADLDKLVQELIQKPGLDNSKKIVLQYNTVVDCIDCIHI